MVNQFDSTKQVKNTFFAGNANILPADSKTSSLGDVGDIISGVLVKGGSDPIVSLNGADVHVKSSVLSGIRTGEEIHLEIMHHSDREITLRLVDQKTVKEIGSSGVLKTEIVNNTAKFVEQLAGAGAANTNNAEEVVEIMNSLSDEEKAKLKQMGIEPDSANSTLIKTLLSKMRGDEHREDLRDSLEAIKEEIAVEQGDYSQLSIRVLSGEEITPDSILDEADSYLPINENQSVYLMQNRMDFTIENLYKAKYSGTGAPTAGPISDADFLQMKPQIERNILAAGLPANEENFELAKHLLSNNLPVDTDNLLTYSAIRDVNQNGFDAARIATNLLLSGTGAYPTKAGTEVYRAKAQQNGDQTTSQIQLSSYRSVSLYFESAAETADKVMDDLNKITDESFLSFAQTGLPYTLKNLSEHASAIIAGETNDGAEKVGVAVRLQATIEQNLSILSESKGGEQAGAAGLTAYRQLEEIRLKMTWEASYALASEDIHIRARELTTVVDALRGKEQEMMKQQMLAADLTPTAENLKMALQTKQVTDALPSMPAAALGATILRGSFNLTTLHEEGLKSLTTIRASQEKVTAYETLMTAPRADMGDSISKAFRNVDDILEDMHLSMTEENRRAVRILGYNSMEVNMQNVTAVKAADYEVQTLLTTMTPAAVLSLLRDGINPLTASIDELNTKLSAYMQDADLAGEEKYSDFLAKLDRKGAITADERKGYIGVYRLLDKIVRSKGKDIGTLVRNGQELTLGNLLSAHRSNRATGMDTTIGDGEIAESAGFANNIESQIEQGLAGISYNRQLTEQVFNRLTPELIDQMLSESVEDLTMEDFYEQIKDQLSDETEASAAEMYVEQMQEELEGNLQELNRFFARYDVMPNLTNFIAAKEIMRDGMNLFGDLRKLHTEVKDKAGTLSESDSFDLSAEFDGIVDSLDSSEEMSYAYGKLREAIGKEVHAADETGETNAVDVRALKQISAGLSILQKMASKRDFKIPVETDGKLSVLNLSIVQDGSEKGLIDASLPTENYGTIRASLRFVQGRFEGTIGADLPEGEKRLEEYSEILSAGLASITNEQVAGELPTTEELFHTAKQFVLLLKRIV